MSRTVYGRQYVPGFGGSIKLALFGLAALLIFTSGRTGAASAPSGVQERMVEWSAGSSKHYDDLFNDVEVDVLFTKDGRSWRVPAFWSGGQRWTVRFAPPEPGVYAYRWQSTDSANVDLNGHEGRVTIVAYRGDNPLLRHGMVRVSANGRYFEQADGTPFYWLGDAWWTGLSDRLSWDGFQTLTADRKAKGFTVIQLVAGLIPSNEERAPTDPGFCNEGGCVWESGFTRINPKYFDAADRRIRHLIDEGLMPVIFGGWREVLPQIGVAKMKQHWRYIIARYGAYPVLWAVGGEVIDAPPHMLDRAQHYAAMGVQNTPGWTEVARYIHAIDPYHHPVSAHEFLPPADLPVQDESLLDFDLLQAGHFGWPSVALDVAQLDLHHARTAVQKPEVQGEIDYEGFAGGNFEDIQRSAFWLSMLNGAAGHTYGTIETAEAYSADKPLHPVRWSLMSWNEAMHLPGSYQVGLGAKLLRQYPWWRFEPRPDWVTPGGTTLLEPRSEINGFDLGSFLSEGETEDPQAWVEANYPSGLWKAHHGTIRRAYAAGIPGEVRMIYIPRFVNSPPTVLGLEPGVRYHVYLWMPSLGVPFDLGAVERPAAGEKLFEESLTGNAPRSPARWDEHRRMQLREALGGSGSMTGRVRVVKDLSEANIVASAEAHAENTLVLVLRYQDPDNYLAVVYSPREKLLYLRERVRGVDGPPLGKTAISQLDSPVHLSSEARDKTAIASMTDGKRSYTTPIVDLSAQTAGSAGLLGLEEGAKQSWTRFELRRSPQLVKDTSLPRALYDAEHRYRGELKGRTFEQSAGHTLPGWDSFGREKLILLDAYRPARLPIPGDWLLVMDTDKSHARSPQ